MGIVQAAELDQLRERARAVRRHIVEMTANAGVGHQGGPLSATDLFVALYFHALRSQLAVATHG